MQTKQELEEWYRVPDPWEYQIKYDDTYRKQQILNILHDRVYDNVIEVTVARVILYNISKDKNIIYAQPNLLVRSSGMATFKNIVIQ